MARPKKYSTDEDRRQAHAEAQRAYRRRRKVNTVGLDREAVEDLMAAVDEAATAGDPVALKVKTGTVDALLRNLARHFREA